MATRVDEWTCLLISPSDLQDERVAVHETIDRWNGAEGPSRGARIRALDWKDDATPLAGMPPQDRLNERLVDQADFGILLLWSRLGTPTPGHPSGSAEELHRLLQDGRPVLVYLSAEPFPIDHDRVQLARLDRFLKSGLLTGALMEKFATAAELKFRLMGHLSYVIDRFAASSRDDNLSGLPPLAQEIADCVFDHDDGSLTTFADLSGLQSERGASFDEMDDAIEMLAASQAIIRLGRDGTVVQAQQPLLASLGAARRDVVDADARTIAAIVAADRSLIPLLRIVAASGLTPRRVAHAVWLLDSARYVDAKPIESADLKVSHVIGSARLRAEFPGLKGLWTFGG